MTNNDNDVGNVLQPHPTLHVQLLGGFETRVDDNPVPPAVWRQRRAASLVKLLALEPGYRLHREHLLDVLWPDLDPENAANNLRVTMHHARRGFLDAGAPAGAFLARDGDVVVLGPPHVVAVDVAAFERAVARAWQDADPGLAELAAGMYRGDLLPDEPFADWAAGRRETLRVSVLSLLVRQSDLYEARGDLACALAARERALAVDPLDEAAHAGVMRLHARMGNPQLALAQYTRYSARLDRELGAAPERHVRELAAAIREGEIVPAPARVASASIATGITPSARIPAAVDALIGRERELAELARLLTQTRLLTLTGPGGIGKTRLALETARAASIRYPDGVGFVDLASVRDPALVLPAVVHALGIDEAGGAQLTTHIASSIGDQRLLLVLDNLEQVATAAPEIAALAASCPNLTLLATSRVRLRLRGEQEYPVLPLPLPATGEDRGNGTSPEPEFNPAVALFVRRAQTARPGFRLTAENADAVVAICRRVDGLPLAIELAAARVRVLAPAQLLRHMARPLDVLGMTASDVPARQRTLRHTIAWSHDLLAPDEQILLRRLGVFGGGCTLEHLTAVVANSERSIDPLESLAGLIDHSLVLAIPSMAQDESRYTMLATIREFAIERLRASGEAESVHQQFEKVFQEFAEQAESGLLGPEQTRWLNRIQEEHDNIRAVLSAALHRGDGASALALATRMTPFWRSRGFALEARAWLENGLAWAASAPKPLHAAALDALGGVTIDLGDYDGADHHYSASLELWAKLGDRRPLMQGLYALATVKANSGDFDAAQELLSEALTIAREIQDDRGIAAVLHNLGMLARENGDLGPAVALLDQAMAIWRRLGDPHWIGVTAGTLGDVHRLAGNASLARDHFAESAGLYKQLGDRFGSGVIANQRGLLEQTEGRFDAAMQSHAEALRHFDAVHASLGIIESIEWLAVAAAESGRPVPALRLLSAATSLRAARGFTPLASDAASVAAALDGARIAAGASADAAIGDGATLTLNQARDVALDLAGSAAMP